MNLLPLFESVGQSNYNRFPLTALVVQARKFKDYRAFSKFYSIDIYHGYYWHLTQSADFKPSDNTGPRDMSSMSDGGITELGALMVTSHLNFWDENYNTELYGTKRRVTRPYVALFDPSALDPEDLRQVGRGFGNEVYLDREQARKMKLLGVYPLKYAKALDRKFHKMIPQSEEELYTLWRYAHGTH